ncbi:Bug family tripartite tricarboxylate transporter substrate binding protein [Plastoroseomonas arctica]|uniref:Tripartite tricarboxylate transporter substrate binding protein n=1 Tax=Plastoroseomonas arctica TaxID=1509237 RepID=A0AAF1KPU7_9PROT|nr:tripartite tricarboxylate transporter substrate-binding protein [Plastoroseomonas arctica]MBR0656533.1 tripartite tricarboxylate transporter substrate binding protein [Plastoroseomonas arctica]
MHRRSLLALTALSAPALAQSGYPDRAITMATGYAPGGSTDIAARLLSDRLGPALGANARVVVENRAGASGMIASEWLKRQPPDGYTLMLVESSSHALIPHALQGGTRYDPINDYAHVAVVATGPLVLVAAPNFPAQSAAEVVARLRDGPQDRMPYASSGVGSLPHFAGEMVAVSLDRGGKFAHVPYRSGGLMVESIARNETQWGVAVLASAAAQVRDNRVRGIAVTGLERFSAFPELPTLAESGIPGFDLANWFAVVAPKDTPAPVVARLNAAINEALTQQQLRERLIIAGYAPWSTGNTPTDARAFFVRESEKYRQVVERTGVRLEQ